MEQLSARIALVLLAASFLASTSMVAVSARYLPTRSNEDRLERLRELLKDLFDSDYEQQQQHNRAYPLPELPVIPERGTAIFKRSVVGSNLPYYSSGQEQHHEMIKGLLVPSPPATALVSGNDNDDGHGPALVQMTPVLYDSSNGRARRGMK